MFNVRLWCATSFVAAKKDGEYREVCAFLDEPSLGCQRIYGSFHSGKSALLERAMLRDTNELKDKEPEAGETWPVRHQNQDSQYPWNDISLFVVRANPYNNNGLEGYISSDNFVSQLLSSLTMGSDTEDLKLGGALFSMKETNRRPVIIVEGRQLDERFEHAAKEIIDKHLKKELIERYQKEAKRAGTALFPNMAEIRREISEHLRPKLVFEYWFAKLEQPVSKEKKGDSKHIRSIERVPPRHKPKAGDALIDPPTNIQTGTWPSRDPIVITAYDQERANETIMKVVKTILPQDVDDSSISNLCKILYAYSGRHLGCTVTILEALSKQISKQRDALNDLLVDNEEEVSKAIKNIIFDQNVEKAIKIELDNLKYSLEIPQSGHLDDELKRRLDREGVFHIDADRPDLVKIMTLFPEPEERETEIKMAPLGETLAQALNPEQLKTLLHCLDLNVSYDDLDGNTHMNRSHDLAKLVWKQDKVAEFLACAPKLNNSVDWKATIKACGLTVPDLSPT